MRPPRSTNTTCIFSMRGAPHVDPLLLMCVRRETVVGQGATVKPEARIDLAERRRGSRSNLVSSPGGPAEGKWNVTWRIGCS